MPLKPNVCEIEFIEYRAMRLDCQSKAEELARKLVRKHKDQHQRSNAPSSIVIEGDDESCRDGPHQLSYMQEISEQNYSTGHTVDGKKRPFELFLCADSIPKPTQTWMKFRNTI